ncbi:hypothetical protein GCM10022414_22180 [Zhongshania borealis]|jgi:hypothetical protein|uniref:Uncharacterized protein n=1 Tax=Zhongshania borealis TaxID=889488 RepID=A0ABP7WUF5_9GAMM
MGRAGILTIDNLVKILGVADISDFQFAPLIYIYLGSEAPDGKEADTPNRIRLQHSADNNSPEK